MFTKMEYIIQKDIQGIIVDKDFITHWCTFSGTPSSYWLPNTVTGGCNDRVRYVRTCARAWSCRALYPQAVVVLSGYLS